MRRLTPLALLLLTSPLALADDLLSKVAVESVFAASVSSTASRDPAETASSGRVTGAGQLGSLLRQAGYEPERIDGEAIRVTVAHGEWTIPTRLRADVARSQIELTMGLATSKPGKDLASEQLLKLLAGSPDTGGCYFAYDPDLRQIQLRRAISARDVSGSGLGRLLAEMAELAVSRESSWRVEAAASKEVMAKTPLKSTTAGSLVGSWVATLAGGEAFAIRLSEAGQFSLAHVKSSQTTTSTGRIERRGQQLSLIGSSGLTIRGELSRETRQGFQLTLGGRKRLDFKRAG